MNRIGSVRRYLGIIHRGKVSPASLACPGYTEETTSMKRCDDVHGNDLKYSYRMQHM